MKPEVKKENEERNVRTCPTKPIKPIKLHGPDFKSFQSNTDQHLSLP